MLQDSVSLRGYCNHSSLLNNPEKQQTRHSVNKQKIDMELSIALNVPACMCVWRGGGGGGMQGFSEVVC